MKWLHTAVPFAEGESSSTSKPRPSTGSTPRVRKQRVQLWTPVYHEELPKEMQVLDSHDFQAVGRLKQGMAQSEATAELSVIVRQLHDQHLDDPFITAALF